MLTRFRFGALALAAASCGLVVSCEKVPLLAPTGSTIVLTAGNTALPTGGTLPVVAQIIESSGTPPHSGTRVTFTTSLGSIEPPARETDVNGQVVVIFRAGPSNGTATITAFSGGATTTAEGALKIAVGTAAVGRVTLTANPNIIQANGGTSVVTASVVDVNGNNLSGVPVSFATSAGSWLTNNVVNTNVDGVATATLTTTTQATVTATVGVQSGTGTGTGTGNGGTTGGSTTGQASATVTINVNPAPTVSISAPTGTLTTAVPINFTITVQPATGSSAQIRSVSVNFGDGLGADLGAVNGSNLSVQHQYENTGTYPVRVTASDNLGATTSAATVVVIQPQAPLVSISSVKTVPVPPGATTIDFTFHANVFPVETPVVSYVWSFGDGVTTAGKIEEGHTYTITSSTRVVSVTVTIRNGQQTTGSITIQPQP